MVREITVTELKLLLDDNSDLQLIDVRELFEVNLANIGGVNIPLNNIQHNIPEIATDKQVVIYCRSGRRSAKAIEFVQGQTGQRNLLNLKGGIIAWSEEIDNTIELY